MSHELRTQVRELRHEDREAAIEVLTASFQGFGPLDQVVGDDDRAQVLMSEYARRCDEAGLEGYLETVRWTDPARRAQERLYERHGFAVAGVMPDRKHERRVALITLEPVGRAPRVGG